MKGEEEYGQQLLKMNIIYVSDEEDEDLNKNDSYGKILVGETHEPIVS